MFKMLLKVPLLIDTATIQSDVNVHRLPPSNGRLQEEAAPQHLPELRLPAAAGKTSYAVIHISDSDELEVFEEENRGGGAPSSD